MISKSGLYFICIFILLGALVYPSLSYPPLSDYWEMFYFFHHLDERPGSVTWAHILNHDPCEHMRFQPLSRVFFYSFHLLFGSDFQWFNVCNMLMYGINIVVLYIFALEFIKSRFLAMTGVGVFTFLFSHFDIVLWSCHIYIIAGFTMCLLSLLSYIRYVKTGKGMWIVFSGILMVCGMLCYESFILWPVGLLFVSLMGYSREGRSVSQRRARGENAKLLAGIYAVYAAAYVYTRMLHTYEAPRYGFGDFLRLSAAIKSFFLALFNTVYTNIIVGLFPGLNFPLQVTENIYMGGGLIQWAKSHQLAVCLMGMGIGGTIGWILWRMYRRKMKEDVKVISFFLFMFLSEVGILCFCRTLTNDFEYCLTEFRYQYIPNAFMVLTMMYAFDRWIKPSGAVKRAVTTGAVVLLVVQVYFTGKIIRLYNGEFRGLQTVLRSIKTGLKNGQINPSRPIFLDTALPDYFPSLCWNIEMGERFIPQGTYEWMFSIRELKSFVWAREDAYWVIDKENFGIVKADAKGGGSGKKVNVYRGRDHTDRGKDKKYVEMGDAYLEKNNYSRAGLMYQKALELNPDNADAKFNLQSVYKRQ